MTMVVVVESGEIVEFVECGNPGKSGIEILDWKEKAGSNWINQQEIK